jgi:FixJ family two-component response regulator
VEVQLSPGLVHIVDDNATFRKTVEGLLQQFGYEVVTYSSAQQLLDDLPNENIPSCIVLDVRLPEMSGPQLQQRLIEIGSRVPIIFLSGYSDVPITVRTMKAGGEDFLIKPVSSEDLLKSVARAIERHKAALDIKQMRDAFFSRIATLTPRERQVFELVIRGKTNKGAATALGSTERTIKAHRHMVMEKLQVRSLVELVSLAQRVGVLDGTSHQPGAGH